MEYSLTQTDLDHYSMNVEAVVNGYEDCVIVKQDTKGEWRWTRYAENNKIVSASSESYKSKQHCIENAVRCNYAWVSAFGIVDE